jgi:hypothetical protein
MNNRIPQGLIGGEPLIESIDLSKVSKTAARSEWWLKVCKTKCKTPFTIYFGPDEHNITHKYHWDSGASEEYDLPGNWNRVYVMAIADNKDNNVYLGICYKNQVCCKHFDFDDNEDHYIKKSDKDEWDCN